MFDLISLVNVLPVICTFCQKLSVERNRTQIIFTTKQKISWDWWSEHLKHLTWCCRWMSCNVCESYSLSYPFCLTLNKEKVDANLYVQGYFNWIPPSTSNDSKSRSTVLIKSLCSTTSPSVPSVPGISLFHPKPNFFHLFIPLTWRQTLPLPGMPSYPWIATLLKSSSQITPQN